MRTGQVVTVRGDRDHPVGRGALCAKCTLACNDAGRDPGQRLLHPLKGAGAKGEGRFEPVTWDRALGGIADRLGAILASGTAETILTAHYTGTCAVIVGGFPMRFFNRLGATRGDRQQPYGPGGAARGWGGMPSADPLEHQHRRDQSRAARSKSRVPVRRPTVTRSSPGPGPIRGPTEGGRGCCRRRPRGT